MDLGVATPEQLARYGDGECWKLAQAIHDATGWPMVLWSDDDGVTGHVMVRCPDGWYVDVESVVDAAHMASVGWRDEPTVVRSADALQWGVSAGDVDDQTRELAARIVAAIR